MSILKDAVNGIDLRLIESQLDLDDYMPEWLVETYDHDPDDTDDIDWYEVLLRALVENAKAAAEVLKNKYGILDASAYPEEE